MNQHPGKAQDDDLSKLQDVIKHAEKTLLVMDGNGQVGRAQLGRQARVGVEQQQQPLWCSNGDKEGEGATEEDEVLRLLWPQRGHGP